MIIQLDQKNKEQAKQILHIQLAAYQMEAEQIGYQDLPPLKETVKDVMDANEIFIGFEKEGSLLGIASYEMHEDRIVLSRLAVHPHDVHQGIGTELMQAIIEHHLPIELTTAEANRPAIRLYEKLGFKQTARLQVENNLMLIKMERSMLRKVEVVEYETSWQEQFHHELDKLKKAVGDNWGDGHHIGSTSIKGMAAKPIIDILLEVKQISKLDECSHLFSELGYEPLGENGLKGRRFFRKGGLQRSHHIHAYEAGHEDVKRHLVFRDYLRAAPGRAKDYADKKRQLAKAHPEDMASYINGKNAIIKEIEQEAFNWSKQLETNNQARE
ncbi:GNAT family N-acetyltransferase [Bacillus sp. ms-22]|uniref:GNAT family N-acetyltransferase n=1 Tax=Bacillus sp. ms-22 TaxID=2683680 RepID=UPI0012FCDCB2|nr:GNAT family N-acetyltransferase [Bacillus sp. ms-22]QGX65568.1 GNAT family N-acetyltransferase [Bacillus sp. ms-22]